MPNFQISVRSLMGWIVVGAIILSIKSHLNRKSMERMKVFYRNQAEIHDSNAKLGDSLIGLATDEVSKNQQWNVIRQHRVLQKKNLDASHNPEEPNDIIAAEIKFIQQQLRDTKRELKKSLVTNQN